MPNDRKNISVIGRGFYWIASNLSTTGLAVRIHSLSSVLSNEMRDAGPARIAHFTVCQRTPVLNRREQEFWHSRFFCVMPQRRNHSVSGSEWTVLLTNA